MASIELSERTAKRIADQAKASGLTVDSFLDRLVPENNQAPSQVINTADLLAEIDAVSFDGAVLPSDFSRADLYRDHD